MQPLFARLSKPQAALVVVLAVLMTLWTVIRLVRQDFFAVFPADGLLTFLTPLAICCVLGALRRPALARLLLLAMLLIFLIYTIGVTGVVAAGLVLVAALAVGGTLARACGYGGSGDLIGTVLHVSLGLAAMTLLLTLLAHLPVNGPLVYGVGLVALCVLSWRSLLSSGITLRVWVSDTRPVAWKTWVGVGLFLGAVALHGCFATYYGTTPDTLAMHLYIPSYMAAYGSWSFDFHKYLWALEPIGSDLLFGMAYQLSDPLGAQLLNASCSVLTAALIFCVCRRRTDSFDALLPATAWLCVSHILYLSGSLHAEGFLTLMLLMAFVSLADVDSAPGPLRAGVITGLLLSAALAVKALTLIMAPVFLLFLLWVPARHKGIAWSLKFMAVVAALLVTLGGFQYLYALAVTGNPVFFLYNGLFHSPYYPRVNFADSHWTGHYGWGLPFDMTFNTQLYGETGAGSAGFQWFMLLPAALVCAFSKDAVRSRWFGAAGIWFAAVALSSEQYLRYILPALAFLAIFIAEIGMRPGAVTRGVYRSCMILAIGLNLFGLQGAVRYYDDLPVDLAFRPDARLAYLQREDGEILANRVIDGLEKTPVNVLYVAHSWAAELRGTAFYQNWYNPELYVAFIRLRRPEGVGALLAKNHIRYVVLDPDFKHVLGAPLVLEYCQTHCQLVTTVGAATIYKVTETAP